MFFSLFFLLFFLLCLPINSLTMVDDSQFVNISLSDYFLTPSQVRIDYGNSTANIDSFLTLLLTANPLQVLKSTQMSFLLDDVLNNLNDFSILQMKTFQDKPSKLFLLDKNILLLYNYNSDDQPKAVRLLPPSLYVCSVMELSKIFYQVIVECHLKNNIDSNEIYLLMYKFELDPTTQVINNIVFTTNYTLKTKQCEQFNLFYFESLVADNKMYQNSMLLYCKQLAQSPIIYNVVGRENTIKVSEMPENQYLIDCLKNASQIYPFKTNFLSKINQTLYFYGIKCNTTISDISNSLFIINQMPYFYVIFADKIYVKEISSQNFQSVIIKVNGNIESYAITQKFLILTVKNQTGIYLHFFQVPQIKQVDIKVLYQKDTFPKSNLQNSSILNSTYTTSPIQNIISSSTTNSSISTKLIVSANDEFPQIRIFSVQNYLFRRNVFFLYMNRTNILNLTVYEGYELVIGTNVTNSVAGNYTLSLTSPASTLEVAILIRGISDNTVSSSQLSKLVIQDETFKINLFASIIGPLGRFYTFPSDLTSFQNINSISELLITPYMTYNSSALFAVAFDKQVISFIYSTALFTCVLDSKIQISQCETYRRRNYSQDSVVIVLGMTKFITYTQKLVEYCQRSIVNDIQCFGILQYDTPINKIKLVQYKQEKIKLIVMFEKELIYYMFNVTRSQSKYALNKYIYFSADKVQIPQLQLMCIIDVYTDTGYDDYLVVYLGGLLLTRTALIYAKVSEYCLGERIAVFYQLETLLHLDHRIIIICKDDVEQYTITANMRVKYRRKYPLYEHTLVRNGNHNADANYIYLQTFDYDIHSYLVYCTKLETPSMLTHLFIGNSDGILIVQRFDGNDNQSIFINGNTLMAICLPNLLISLSPTIQKAHQQSLYLSFIDNREILNILQVTFTYIRSNQIIQYTQQIADIVLNEQFPSKVLKLNNSYLLGPVSTYNFTHNCDFLSITTSDIFTPRQCLLLSNAKQYGTVQDFYSFQGVNSTIQIIVTQSYYVCVLDRAIRSKISKKISFSSELIKSGSKELFSVLQMLSNTRLQLISINQTDCSLTVEQVQIPYWLKYQQFEILYKELYLIIAVPTQDTTLYFACKYQNKQISSFHSQLQKQNSMKFHTTDASVGNQYFFLLENDMNDITIYNLTDIESNNSKLEPSVCISEATLRSVLNVSTKFVYLQYLSTDLFGNVHLEIGSEYQAQQLIIQMSDRNLSCGFDKQTVVGDEIQLGYTLLQQHNCYNDIHSKSNLFHELRIKICSYEPQAHYLFADFIRLREEKANNYVQFYDMNKQKGDNKTMSIYPFRMQVIYNTEDSKHILQITGNKLVIASLFNFMCYYDLNQSISWTITKQTLESSFDTNQYYLSDQYCNVSLELSNLKENFKLNFGVINDRDYDIPNYWTYIPFNIHRLVIILIVINSLRLFIKKRKNKPLVKKKSNNMFTNEFQIQVKINSKKSI